MDPDNKKTAMSLISVHGARAQAVVGERLAEARLQGDASGVARWQSVETAVNELRRTSPAHA
ncbi:MAG TPA: hypothetical protein VH023_07645 [Rhodopila sp.]|jgi:hypothetical protein|nr:hypothetical protein [Rhodopila sp.]